jgi:hypothetical protein
VASSGGGGYGGGVKAKKKGGKKGGELRNEEERKSSPLAIAPISLQCHVKRPAALRGRQKLKIEQRDGGYEAKPLNTQRPRIHPNASC